MRMLVLIAVTMLATACGGGEPEAEREHVPACTTYHDTSPPRKVCL